MRDAGVDFRCSGWNGAWWNNLVSVRYQNRFFSCVIFFVLPNQAENTQLCFVFIAKDYSNAGKLLVFVKPVRSGHASFFC